MDYILALISISFSVYAIIRYRIFAKVQRSSENKILALNLTIKVLIYSILGIIVVMLGGKYGILPIILESHGSSVIVIMAYTVYIIMNCMILRAFIKEKG